MGGLNRNRRSQFVVEMTLARLASFFANQSPLAVANRSSISHR